MLILMILVITHTARANTSETICSGHDHVQMINSTFGCIIRSAQFCLPCNYDMDQKPQDTKTKGAIMVKVKFMVEQITEVNDKKFTVDILTYMSLYWQDPKLVFIGRNSSSLQTPEDIPLSYAWSDKLWQPDVFVEKMKGVRLTKILDPFGSMCN